MRYLSILLFSIFFAVRAAGQIQVREIKSSAAFNPELPAPGSLASIGVWGLRGISGIVEAAGYPLPTELAGVSVFVNGSPAPILAAADQGWYQQINIQIPKPMDNVPPPSMIEVRQNGQSGKLDVTEYLSTVSQGGRWGVLFRDTAGYGVFQHADYSAVTTAQPAQPGEVMIAYGTNYDSYSNVSNPPPDGYPSLANPLSTASNWFWPKSIHFNSGSYQGVGEILWAGLTPGMVGVFQINFRVPADIPDGNAEVSVVAVSSCVGGMLCPASKWSLSVYIPVRRPAS